VYRVANPQSPGYLQRLGVVPAAIGAIGLVGGGVLAVVVSDAIFVDAEEAPLTAPVAAEGAQSAGAGSDVSGRARGARPRTPRAPQQPPPPLEQFTQMYDWPAEPDAPATVDDPRFAEAMAFVCGSKADPAVRTEYAGWVTAYAREFGVDPFLLGGLIAQRSGCRRSGAIYGVGLTGLVPELYLQGAHDGVYDYDGFVDGKWVQRRVNISRFSFEPSFVSAPESNIYFAAAFLRAWQEQHRGLFSAFVQHEYRHYVSHFVWGDVVDSNRQEDGILIMRRRLLEYYGARQPAAAALFEGDSLGCPLDGCPRVITSTLGDSREDGKRSHRGVDFESVEGEPVRAVADGKVEFAGADLPGKTAHKHLPIYAQSSVAKSIFGAGGIYVCIRHVHVMTCYMHLQSSKVEMGRVVKRGEIIGTVGRTGIQTSPPHLHFEVHARGSVVAATEAMPKLVLGRPRNTPMPTDMADVKGPQVPSAGSGAAKSSPPPRKRGLMHVDDF
jgi:murein DD-endopeptidase MepM/ murein hydrolase activator NlpD